MPPGGNSGRRFKMNAAGDIVPRRERLRSDQNLSAKYAGAASSIQALTWAS